MIKNYIGFLYRGRIFLQTLFKQIWFNTMYQNKIVLRHYSNKQMPKANLFYSYLGRLFFITKELYCFSVNSSNRTIQVEYFEGIDMKNKYSQGNHNIIWPKPASVELEKQQIEQSFFDKLKLSYDLSYQNDPNKFPMSQWWIDMTAQFKEHFFDNNEQLINTKLINFRNEAYTDAAIITDQLNVVNKKFGFRKSYLNSIYLVCEYHRMAKIVKSEILSTMSESQAGENLCTVYRGKRLSYRMLTHATYLDAMLNNIKFKEERKNVILEIGGAYGGLARLMKYHIRNSCHIIVELPEVAMFAGYFLKYSFPNLKIGLLDDILQDNNIKNSIDKYDFIVIPTWYIEKIQDKSVDLVINTTSIGEMSKEFGEYYINNIDRLLMKNGYFLSVNRLYSQVEKYDDFGFYNFKFKSQFETKLYKQLPVGYPVWVGQKQA